MDSRRLDELARKFREIGEVVPPPKHSPEANYFIAIAQKLPNPAQVLTSVITK